MAQVDLWGATYNNVPAVNLPSGNSTVRFTDTSVTTAVESDVASGKIFIKADGSQGTGTASGGSGSVVVTDVPNSTGTTAVVSADDVTTLTTKSITQNGTYNASSDNADGYSSVTVNVSGGSPSATQHTIHLEFSNNTDTDIPVYYNDSVLGTMITAYEPSGEWIYNNKIVTSAALDNAEWYEYTPIPLNTELVDYSACTQGYCIDEYGDAVAQQWSWISDYIPIKAGMTFSYRNYYWFYIGLYDSSESFIRAIAVSTDSTPDPNDSNTGIGTLSGDKIPSNAAYVRLCGQSNSASYMSLIRTA